MKIFRNLVREQEKNLYDFLMMKFIQCKVESQSQFCSQTPQLNSSYHLCTKNRTLISLFIDDDSDLTKPYNITSDQRQNKQEEFANMLKLFGLEFNSINQLNFKLFEVVRNVSFARIVKNNLIKMNLDIEDETDLFEKNQHLSLMVETLIISKTIAFEKTDIQADFQRLYNEVQSSLNYFIQQNHQLFQQSQLHFDLKGTIERDISVFLKEIYFREENNEDKLRSHFLNSFEQFKAIITVQQRLPYKNIIDLHFFSELLSNRSKYDQSLKMKTESNEFLDCPCSSNLDLQSINCFTVYKTVEKSSQLRLNKIILNWFLKQPYQTSVFVLYILLKNSQIKNVNKIFEINSNEKFIDPVTFLLVDTQLITPLNSETFSLSLWIVLETWINYVQSVRQQNHEDSSDKKSSQIPSKSYDFSVPSTQPLKIISGDPRRIYAVKRPDKEQSLLRNQVMHQTTQSFSQQFEVQYKRPLMYTMVVYLLTLKVQTTMLKYYPIETDLIKQLIQGDLLPQLLVKNQYLFKARSFSSNCNEKRKSDRNKVEIEKEFLNKIQNASSIEELERLKMEYEKYTQTLSSGTITHEDDNNEFREYPLPWVSLIESKQVLCQLLNKPAGYSLALNFIERHPNTFTKMYETYIPSMIISEMEHKNHLKRNEYKFKGNRNTKCKKTIGYLTEKVKNNDITQHEQQKNDSAKTEAMKKIMELYRSKLTS